ncbi:hypothetical protein L195_g003712 [Trifolium pratense]|uniref:Uncharacterized protein n=1 Tax=Trifolium pratense TaxID=57577 RepID=A0A2K3NW25_TRIPR|nr:hypothetical protein L195_g003712 [Trifolium pratense]
MQQRVGRSCTLIAATAGCTSSGLDGNMPPGGRSQFCSRACIFSPVPMLHLQPPCTTELPSNAHVFGFASMLSVLFNYGCCYFWKLFAIFSVIKFALHKGNVDKKEALENLNFILIVLCINELILRVNSS